MPDDRFADALALAGGSAVVASARADSGRGAVYLFGGSAWEQQARIAPDSLSANARFGSSLAVRDGVALVGAPGANAFGGTVYRYRGAKATPVESGTNGELLGYAVI